MLIIFNPAAGSRRRRRLDRALDALRALAIRHEVAETRHAGHATRIAREAANCGLATVIAAGGDGTVAEVAAGIAGSDTTLGVLPLGTANVLAWELGIPIDPRRAAEVLARRNSCRVHPGRACFADGSQRLFVQMVGAGLDAAVVAHLDPRLKRMIGRGAYVLQTLREMARYDYAPITVDIDGEVQHAASVVVTKGHYYAGRFVLAPDARPVEPGFHVVMLRRGGALSAIMAGAALPLGLFPSLPGVALRRAARVSIRGAAAHVQADGDPAGLLPVTIEDEPRPIRMLV